VSYCSAAAKYEAMDPSLPGHAGFSSVDYQQDLNSALWIQFTHRLSLRGSLMCRCLLQQHWDNVTVLRAPRHGCAIVPSSWTTGILYFVCGSFSFVTRILLDELLNTSNCWPHTFQPGTEIMKKSRPSMRAIVRRTSGRSNCQQLVCITLRGL
jgi:hypothetical protein